MISRLFCAAALSMGVVTAFAADVPANSPFGQAGAPAATGAQADTLQFAGVSTLGKKTMVNLYDTRAKHSFWVEAGQTEEGVTVVSYDNAHDQVTVRVNGVEKTLPLRPPSAVVSGPATPVPVMAPVQPAATPAMSPTPVASVPSEATPASTSTTSLSRARQEEEARMLVSDLLEIGMAQRKAYEEAKRKQAEQASGQQPAQPADTAPATAPIQPDQGAAQPATGNAAQTAPAATPTGS